MAFLAVCDVHPGSLGWSRARSGQWLRTREIITWVNEQLGESISSGSYDDIRRRDLLAPALAGIVISSLPDSARNDSRRAWGLNPEYLDAVRAYGGRSWEKRRRDAIRLHGSLEERLGTKRELRRVEVVLPGGAEVNFGPGEHNQLIKAVIEQFLPRFAGNARVLYVGDAERRMLIFEEDALRELGAKVDRHSELPDVVAFDDRRKWLFVVEAVHTGGTISPERRLRLRRILAGLRVHVILVTAFATRQVFRRFVGEIAWETEVWIAGEADHLVHFDGEKFLGPYET